MKIPSSSPILLLLLLLSSTSLTQSNPNNKNCDKKWIHIRNLPSRFNTDLLQNCNSFPLFSNSFCPFLTNHGLGPRTHNNSLSWYRTDPHFLEPFFHKRILEYPCLTSNPFMANAIFLPYYTSLDALKYLYSPDLYNESANHGIDLHRFIRGENPSIWSRRSGQDHFLVISRPAWDFSQDPSVHPPSWGTSFLRLPFFQNLTVLTVESRPDPWQEQAIPYPTSFHPANLDRLRSWLDRARRSRRKTLMLFAGGGGSGGPNIRGSIRAECENRTDLCEIVDCSNGVCNHDPIRYMLPMLRSRFCLEPPGDTPTRRSTFDAIIAGCVPVFFEEVSARRQYGWHLGREEYEKFSVFVAKESVVFGGLRIGDVLEGIEEEEVERMRRRVLEIAPRVLYRRYGSSEGLRAVKDAVDIAIDGVLRRIERRGMVGFDYGDDDGVLVDGLD